MTSRKSQNSILFLTTLGVYLGLVLVGATPQILAQAATAKQFSVKDEIEVKDELDGDLLLDTSSSLDRFLRDTEGFIVDLREVGYPASVIGYPAEIQIGRTAFFPCVGSNARTFRFVDTIVPLGPDAVWKKITGFSYSFLEGYSLSDCLPSGQFDGKQARTTHHEFKIDHDGFCVELTLTKASKNEARDLFRSLQVAFKEHDTEDTSQVGMLLLEYMSFRVNNDQVSITTNLPRAKLDSLLATDAK